MSTITPIINSFAAGELSPHMEGRTDHEKYYTGCRRLENMCVRPHGTVFARSGTRHIAAAKDEPTQTRLLGFDAGGVEHAYVLELTAGAMRFFKAGELIEKDGVPYEIATPWTESMLADLQRYQEVDVVFFAGGGVPPQKLERHGDTDWRLAPVKFDDGPWLPAEAGDAVTVTPAAREGDAVAVTATADVWEEGHVGAQWRFGYVAPDDAEVKGWSYGEITAVAGPRECTIKILKPLGYEVIPNSDFSVGIEEWEDKSSGGTVEYNPTAQTLKLSRTAGDARAEVKGKVTANAKYVLTVDVAAVGAGGARVYAGTSEGGTNVLGTQVLTTTGKHEFPLGLPSKSDLFVTVDMQPAANGEAAEFNRVSVAAANLSTADWREGAFCTANGWPKVVTKREGRLLFASTTKNPLMYWMSESGGLYERFAFSTPLVDSDALTDTVNANKAGVIKWMQDSEGILVGTNANEVRVSPAEDGAILVPTKPIKTQRQSGHGSGALPARMAGQGMLFVTRSGRQVRELSYDLAQAKHISAELTILAEHVTASGVRDWTYAAEPDGVLWCVREDGTLAACTYRREENVVAWHRHFLGGNGRCESIACIPGPDGDEVWMVVRREIGGQSRRYVERLEQRFEGLEPDGSKSVDARRGFFVDSGVAYDLDAEATEFTGLDHLEGQTVQVLADGGVRTEREVSGGKITLARAAKTVRAGLGYSCVVQPMRPEISGATGSSQGKKKRVLSVLCRTHNSVGGKVCAGDDVAEKYENIPAHSQPMRAGAVPSLQNTDRKIKLASGMDADGLFTLRQDDPLPMTVLCIVPKLEVAG